MQHTEHSATPPGDFPAVAAYGLQVARGTQSVLRNVSFTIPRGRIVGLLGPSGCGKTTLLRCVVGVQQPSGGHVQVLGHAAGAWPLRTRVGYVTQAPSVYADLTVLENLRYFAAALGMRGWHREDAVVRVVKEVDLVAYADQPVARLSGGQYSRVSLAVALLNRPDLLVMDEPTVGLDPMVRRELWLVFQRLAEEGTTLLVSSHVMDEADRCDRLLLMRSGRLLASADRNSLLEHTGCDEVEEAFLHLVRAAAAAEARARQHDAVDGLSPHLLDQPGAPDAERTFFAADTLT
ncbi:MULTISPECIES: ABC transporter ATP-binding protein [unclassified Streptomyces]|uniref:ABC transporter ATP-binding protein n=1 Tax=unclassified Streptomyces TaxID=2593676 RepID=UPI0028773304|nr:ABC transporter ATP-binding protein [Streptomyces sp. BB1-1-1]WND39400.1 ABC transporter ATP-binding protein [Streptomyces sp. BB1-1-1]